LACTPTLAVPGVPESLPVDALKFAQLGLLLMVNASGSPSASDAVGVN